MIYSKHLAVALYKLSKEAVPTDKIMSALYAYLEKHKLLSLLPATLKHLEKLEKQDKQFQSLKITSSLPVDQEILVEIKDALRVEKSVAVETETDSEIVGGFIATHHGFIYDASLKTQLNLLKTKLIEN